MMLSHTNSQRPQKVRLVVILIVCFIVIGLMIAGVVAFRHHQTAPVVTKKGCVTQSLSVGSNGTCVADVKAMIDYIETSGLNECPFTNGDVIPVNDTYDEATLQQVKVVQTWINCYNKQEGSTQSIAVSGSVDNTTWLVLCSYGYRFPKQSQSTTSVYHAAAIQAGQAAGCETDQ